MSDKIKELSQVIYAAHKLDDAQNIQDGIKQVDILKLSNPDTGSYRYLRPDTGEEIIVSPHDRMYSASSLLATHMYDGEKWCDLNFIGDENEH